jgi:hypothetical protein
MIVSVSHRKSESIQKWRRQIGCRMHSRAQQGARPHALLTYRVDGEAENGFVRLDRILFLVLFDESRWNGCDELQLRTRFVGYSATFENGRIQIGGNRQCRFAKDLRRSPTVGGRGSRLDALDRETVDQAFASERHLERHARHPHYPRRNSPKLPSLWAIKSSTAEHGDLTKLAPLEEMPLSDGLVNVFVDLRSFPKRQVLKVNHPRRDLCGRAGRIDFDFYHTPFHSVV